MLTKFCAKCKHFYPYHDTYYKPKNPAFGFCNVGENCPFAIKVQKAVELDDLILATREFLEIMQKQLDNLDVTTPRGKRKKKSDIIDNPPFLD